MPRRPTKRLLKAREQFVAAVKAHLHKYHAQETPDGMYSYVLNTPAGPLGINVTGTEVFQRFGDVEAGTLFTRMAGVGDCNPFSGKWNFQVMDDALLSGDTDWWFACIDKLMSVPYGHEPLAERLDAWLASATHPTAVEAATMLSEVRTRVSDLGSLLADVEQARKKCPLVETLYRRLCAIRDIVVGD